MRAPKNNSLRYIVSITAVVMSCLPSLGAEPHGAAADSAAVPRPKPHKWLPYGVPIPEGTVITAFPEPYDPERHGPPVANTQPEKDRSQDPSIPQRRRDMSDLLKGIRPHDQLKALTDWHEGRGWWVQKGRGIYAQVDVQRNISMPPWDAIMYAPTHYPAGGSCLEATVIHQRSSFFDSTHDRFGFWDWCTLTPPGNWGLLENMDDSSWRSKYVRVALHTDNSTAEEVAVVEVYAQTPNAAPGSNDCWYGLLYNFNLGQYELKITRCGVTYSGFTDVGWSMWESYGLSGTGSCPSFPGITAESVIFMDTDGLWYGIFVSGAKGELLFGPSGSCWTNGTWTLDEAHLPNMWHAHTPTNSQ